MATLRDSQNCEVCHKPFRVGQSAEMILVTDPRDECEPIHGYAHLKCAAPILKKEKEREAEIERLLDEMSHLDYYASRAYGRGTKDSITHKALRSQRRKKRQVLEMQQGPGWRDDQWEALKRKYRQRCVCCGKKGVPLDPDHIEPIEKGGEHHIRNIQPLCRPCNMKKGARYRDYRPDDVRLWEREIRELERLRR